MESLLINSEPNRKLKSKNDIIKLLESFLFTLYTAIHFFNPKEIISEKEILLNTIKKKGNELNILEGKIELYEKLLQTREEQRKKEIDSLLKTFIAYCEEYDCSSPTLPNLSKYSGVSLEVWKNKFGISQNADFVVARSFIELLLSGIKKKGNYNKRNRDKMLFWNEVFEKIETRLKKIQNKLKTDMTQMKMVEYSEKIDNRYTVKKKKRSEPDKKKTINYLDNEEKLCIECKERYAYENGICKVCWNEQYPTRNTI
ncbi:hypothetical protein KKG22_05790 [Patescibacteria group bacterium]|nr:hypothetical protein [Patescibacteria group bacterium]